MPFQQIGLNPVATPTDQFVAPRISRPTPDSELIGLAQSLSKVYPELNQVAQNRFEAGKRADQMLATQDAMNMRFKSMADLKQAVDDGKLPAWQSPWYRVQLTQEVARDQVAKAAAAMHEQYMQRQDLQSSDAIEPVAQFADQSLAPVIQGADPWAVEAAAPLMQQAKHQLLMQHAALRDERRQDERQEAYGRELANSTASINDNDKNALAITDEQAESDESSNANREQARARLASARESVQAAYNTASMTVDKKTLDNWTRQALTNTALDRGSVRVWDDVAANLTDKSGNKVFGTDADLEHGKQLGRQIQREQMADLELDETRRQLMSKRAARSASADIWQQYATKAAAAQASGQKFGIWDMDMTGVLSKLGQTDPDAANHLAGEFLSEMALENNQKASVDKQTITSMIADKGMDFMNGTMSKDDEATFMKSLLRINGGDQAAEAIQRLRNWSRSNAWGVTSPESWNKLADLYTNVGPDSPDFIPSVVKMSQDGELDEHTASTAIMHSVSALSEGTKATHVNAAITGLSQQIPARIEQGYIDKLPGKWADYNRADAHTLVEQRASLAHADFMTAAVGMQNDPAFRSLPVTEKLQKLNDLADSIVSNPKYGGLTAKESDRFLNDQNKFLQDQQQQQPKSQAIPATISPRSAEDAIADMANRGSPVLQGVSPEDVARVKTLLETKKPPLTGEDVATYSPPQPLGDRYTMYSVGGPVRERTWGDVFAGRPGKWSNYTETLSDHIAKLIYHYKSEANGTNKIELGGNERSESDQQALRSEAFTDYQAVLTEARAKEQAMVNGDTAKKYKSLQERLNTLKPNETPNPEDWKLLAYMHNQLADLGQLRRAVGWAPDEVKAMGGDAWKTHQMFFDEDELYRNGGKVMEQLGVPPERVSEFRVAQRSLIAQTIHRQH